MRVRKLQCKLIHDVIYMRRNGREPGGWEDTLKEYSKALQDHDYMEGRRKSPRDPFLASGEYLVDKYVFDMSLPPDLLRQKFSSASSICNWERDKNKAQAICGTGGENLSKTRFKNLKRRIAVACIGGVFLIGPMWLMVLHNALYAVLTSATVFVFAFGLLMACSLDQERDVLASTAAYAAVLVVFVGASIPSVSGR